MRLVGTTKREFTDKSGQSWRVSYTEAGVRGMIIMKQIVFRSLDEPSGAERFLTVHPGYLESADDHQLEVALSQAQRVDPPW